MKTLKEDNPVSEKFAEKYSEWIVKKFFVSQGKLLDLGCGSGVFTKAFKKLGFEVQSCDKTSNNGCDVVNLENDKLPYSDNYFDYVFCRHVIDHLNNANNMMKEAYRVLKDGGIVWFEANNWEDCSKTFYCVEGHKHPYTKKSLEILLRKSKFRNVKVFYFRPVPYIWRFTTKAFDFVFPTGFVFITGIGEK